jgi:DsbC/DsbD-like thiol-disulfide interchange protein
VRRPLGWLTATLVVALAGMSSDEPAIPSVKINLETPSNRRPVVAGAALAPAKAVAGGTLTLVVKAEVAPTWHIYAADETSGSSIPTTLKLTLPSGVTTSGDWTYPTPAPGPTGDGWIYAGALTFRRTLKVSADAAAGPIDVTCVFGYQACDPSTCRPPAKITLKAKAEVLPAR